jgi:hypothetical protein
MLIYLMSSVIFTCTYEVWHFDGFVFSLSWTCVVTLYRTRPTLWIWYLKDIFFPFIELRSYLVSIAQKSAASDANTLIGSTRWVLRVAPCAAESNYSSAYTDRLDCWCTKVEQIRQSYPPLQIVAYDPAILDDASRVKLDPQSALCLDAFD